MPCTHGKQGKERYYIVTKLKQALMKMGSSDVLILGTGVYKPSCCSVSSNLYLNEVYK